MADLAWADLARNSAQSLALLGYPVSACLPGDAEPCGGSYAEHAAANLIAMMAVNAHHLKHLAPSEELFDSVYDDTVAKLNQPGCQLYHVDADASDTPECRL
jgi:hypothetical protein